MDARTNPDPASLLDLATRAARDAGALLLERFGGPASGVIAKSTRTDLASDADRDAEAIILTAIRDARPDDRIVAEESGDSASGDGGLTWHVDPLDGTINYLWGIPAWCVSIQVEGPHGDLAAVVFDPGRDELFTATPHDTRLNGRQVTMAPADDVGDALVATGFGYLADRRRLQGAVLAGLLPHIRDIRRGGSAALDLAWLAAGRVDAYYEYGPQVWDWAAGRMLVRAAGGELVNLDGLEDGATGMLATRPGLVEPLRALIERG